MKIESNQPNDKKNTYKMPTIKYGNPLCKDILWDKCMRIPRKNPAIYRLDPGNKIIKYKDHGKHTKYGWQIDHIIPKAKNGADHIENLQALHWLTNQSIHEDIRNKPGLDPRYFHEIMCEKYEIPTLNRGKKPHIKPGNQLFARKMVNCRFSHATVLSIDCHLDQVQIRWLSTGHIDTILYDSLLFCPIEFRRRMPLARKSARLLCKN